MFTGTTETAKLQLRKYSVCEFTDFKTLVTIYRSTWKNIPRDPIICMCITQ